MSGTGHAGMEACIANLVEPGETVLVGNKGIWGMRVADLAGRYGAKVVEMTVGGEARAFSLDEITKAVEKHKPALLFLCQGESSMGALPHIPSHSPPPPIIQCAHCCTAVTLERVRWPRLCFDAANPCTCTRALAVA